jgi:hypothetical protein
MKSWVTHYELGKFEWTTTKPFNTRFDSFGYRGLGKLSVIR